MRIYEDDEQERDSIIAWIDRRLNLCSHDAGMIMSYTKQLKKMWFESFGGTETIPTWFKEKIEKIHEAAKSDKQQP